MYYDTIEQQIRERLQDTRMVIDNLLQYETSTFRDRYNDQLERVIDACDRLCNVLMESETAVKDFVERNNAETKNR